MERFASQILGVDDFGEISTRNGSHGSIYGEFQLPRTYLKAYKVMRNKFEVILR